MKQPQNPIGLCAENGRLRQALEEEIRSGVDLVAENERLRAENKRLRSALNTAAAGLVAGYVLAIRYGEDAEEVDLMCRIEVADAALGPSSD